MKVVDERTSIEDEAPDLLAESEESDKVKVNLEQAEVTELTDDKAEEKEDDLSDLPVETIERVRQRIIKDFGCFFMVRVGGPKSTEVSPLFMSTPQPTIPTILSALDQMQRELDEILRAQYRAQQQQMQQAAQRNAAQQAAALDEANRLKNRAERRREARGN